MDKFGSGQMLIDPTALTIDDINPSDTPSLVAYYKGYDAVNGVIPDHSGNGLDIVVTTDAWTYATSGAATTNIAEEDWIDRSFVNLNDATNYISNYFAIAPNMVGLVNVTGTPLDTQSNYVIWAGEFLTEQTIDTTGNASFLQGGEYRPANDIDFGTAWDFEGSHATNTYSGFTFPMALNSWWARIAIGSNVDTPAFFTQFIDSGSPVNFAAGYRPSTDVREGINGTTSNTATGASSLTAQDGKFGFSSSSGQERVMFRNVQVWSFSSEPYEMLNTIEWMGLNPGKIPPWWIGR